MSLTLVAPAGNLRASKIVIAAELAKITLVEKHVDYKDLRSKQFLAKYPLGKVPILESPEGPIFQSFAILRYIARKGNALFGSNSYEQAQIESWLEQTLVEFEPLIVKLLDSLWGWKALTEQVYNNLVKELKDWFKNLDSHLKDKTYLVGNSLTIADIAVATYVHYIYKMFYDQKSRAGNIHVLRWYNQVSSINAFTNYMGPVHFCKQPFQAALKSVEEEKTEAVEEKVSKPKNNAKKEKVPEPKPQTQSKNKKKKEQVQDEDDEEPVAKKEANPLDLLPKSPFNLDDYKREISNNPDKLAATKSLWQKFDAEGWSIWKSVYDKYEGQGVVGYETSNLMKGFLRNLESFRKYTFAMVGIYGVQGDYNIKGAWLWRGTEIPQELKDHQSFEYYKFTKLDHNNEADRQVVEEYWSKINEGDIVQGVPFYDGKYFK